MAPLQHSPLSDKTIRVRVERPYKNIVLLVLDYPSRRNCLSYATLLELKKILQEIAEDRSVSALVIAAEGPSFCAGHDLEELRSHTADEDKGRAFFSQTLSLCSEVMQSLSACPQPVIAAVQGVATAAGCQLVASCDLAVAEETARFATPGIHIGLFCSTPMVALTRNISRKRALEMLLLGDPITAREAAEVGLINRIVPHGQAREGALQMAVKIASKSSEVIRLGKAAFYHQIEDSLPRAYDYATRVMVDNLLTPDAQEGIEAFLEKRPPVWKGS